MKTNLEGEREVYAKELHALFEDRFVRKKKDGKPFEADRKGWMETSLLCMSWQVTPREFLDAMETGLKRPPRRPEIFQQGLAKRVLTRRASIHGTSQGFDFSTPDPYAARPRGYDNVPRRSAAPRQEDFAYQPDSEARRMLEAAMYVLQSQEGYNNGAGVLRLLECEWLPVGGVASLVMGWNSPVVRRLCGNFAKELVTDRELGDALQKYGFPVDAIREWWINEGQHENFGHDAMMTGEPPQDEIETKGT
jgi:hypothetical protein